MGASLPPAMRNMLDTTARAELVAQAKASDRNAFDELVGPLIESAFRLAFGMLHDREAAEDAVQEAAFKAWRSLRNLRPGTEMRPWFFAIVANQCRSTVRHRWWEVLRLDGQGGAAQSVEDPVVRGADLRRAIRQLNRYRRLALVLHFYLDLSLEEVAAIARVPVGTVKSRIHRAVAQLRPQLDVEEVFG